MNLIKVSDLISLIRSSATYASFLSGFDKPSQHEARDASAEKLDEICEQLYRQCEELGLDVAMEQLRVFRGLFQVADKRVYVAAAERSTAMIASTIETQLKLKLFFVLPPESRKFYTEPALFGVEVENAFPSAIPEISEAGKCFACARYSGAVFHLMRTLEVGIHALAKQFNVVSDHKNWENVLNEIQKAVGKIDSVSHGPSWKDEQHFSSEACAHFMVLKNAWRNYAMHLHERYDQERAQDIYNSVRAFMRHLATRLKESP